MSLTLEQALIGLRRTPLGRECILDGSEALEVVRLIDRYRKELERAREELVGFYNDLQSAERDYFSIIAMRELVNPDEESMEARAKAAQIAIRKDATHVAIERIDSVLEQKEKNPQ